MRRLVTLVALIASVAAVSADGVSWVPAGANVRVVCPITVGGSFEAHTSSLTGTLSAATGAPSLEGHLEVDLRTLDSGIDVRNDHMRNTYLEVGKGAGFDHAVLTGMAIGKGDAASFDGKTTFTARLSLHGTERPVTGDVEIRSSSTGRKVSATFPVSLRDFGIDTPRYLGVGVKDQIQIKVTFIAAPSRTGA